LRQTYFRYAESKRKTGLIVKVTYSPLVIFLSVLRTCWKLGLCSGFSCQQLRIKSSIVLPRSDDSGSVGLNGILSPLRTRFTTSVNCTQNDKISLADRPAMTTRSLIVNNFTPYYTTRCTEHRCLNQGFKLGRNRGCVPGQILT